MRIATFINVHQEIVSFYEKGRVCLFENSSGSWINKKEIPIEINKSMGLAELRGSLKNVAAQAEGCDVFLVGESRGLLHVFLSELGFRTWRSEGTLIEQLENVSLKDAETLSSRNSACHSLSFRSGCRRSFGNSLDAQGGDSMAPGRTMPVPLCVGDPGNGHYRINLVEVLGNEPNLTFKQILLPFLREYEFQKLEVFCDHLPKWMTNEIDQLNFRMESEEVVSSLNAMKVTIFSKNNSVCEVKKAYS